MNELENDTAPMPENASETNSDVAFAVSGEGLADGVTVSVPTTGPVELAVLTVFVTLAVAPTAGAFSSSPTVLITVPSGAGNGAVASMKMLYATLNADMKLPLNVTT